MLFLKISTIALFSVAGYFIDKKRPYLKHALSTKINWNLAGFSLITVYFVFYLILKITQHYSFHTNAFDLSIYDYAVANTLRGKFLFVPFLNGSFFQEHFSPILLLLTPWYMIKNSPVTLLVIQCLAVAGAAWPLFLLASRQLGNKALALIIVFAYLNNWYLVHGLLYDFHVEMFEPLLIILMLWGYLERKYLVYWISLLLALMCKEDVGLYLFFFGLLVLIKEKRIKLGLITSGASLLWVFTALLIIALMNNEAAVFSGYKFLTNWIPQNTSLSERFFHWTSHPLETAGIFLNMKVFRLFYPLAFLPLFSWWGILLLAPIGLNASSANSLQAGFMLYYSAPIIPFLFVGVIFGLKNILKRNLNKFWILLALCLYLVAFNVHRYFPDSLEARHKTGRAMLQSIPENVPLAAQSSLVPHISHRGQIHILPRTEASDEYIALDLAGNPFPMTKQGLHDIYKSIKNNPKYREIFNKDDFILFQKSKMTENPLKTVIASDRRARGNRVFRIVTEPREREEIFITIS